MAFKIILASLLALIARGQSLERDYTIDARNAFDSSLYDSVLDPVQCELQLNYLTNSSLAYRCKFLIYWS